MENYKVIEPEELEEMIQNHKLFLDSGGYRGEFTKKEVKGKIIVSYSKQGTKGKMFDISNRCIPEGTILSNRNLSYSILSNSICKGVTFNEVDLGSCLMDNSDFEGSVFKSGYLSCSDFSNSNFKNSSFIDLTLYGIDFKDVNYENADFVAVDFTNIKNIRPPYKTYTQSVNELKGLIDSNEYLIRTKQKIINKLNEIIEDGEVFIFDKIQKNLSRGYIYDAYQIIDGKRVETEKSEQVKEIVSYRNTFFDKYFTNYTIFEYRFEKNKFTITPFTREDIVSLIKRDLSIGHIDLARRYPAELRHTETTIECIIEGEEANVNGVTTEYYPETETKPYTPMGVYDDAILAFYYSLEQKAEIINLVYKNHELTIKTIPPLPEYGYEEYIEPFELPELEPTDITELCALLESTNRTKIEHALSIASLNDETTKFIQNRYFPLAKARLNKHDLDMLDLTKGLLNGIESSFLLRTGMFRNIGEDFIRFNLCSDLQCKLIVDFIGSLVYKHIDMDDFIKEAQLAPNEKKLISIYKKYTTKVKQGLKTELTYYPDGWYEQLISRLLKLKVKKIFFEKTAFYDASQSIYLKGFVFFIGMNSSNIHVDILQSEDSIDFTEVFWMLKTVPYVSTMESDFYYPKQTLAFKR